ncbi:MAG: hypothetical protein Fur007_07520 [Rhodoferax sp.]
MRRENPSQREFAQSDPQGFMGRCADGAVIDGAQRCPALFPWLQVWVDEARKPAHFVLAGSQQFGLLAGITQSLAGRVAMIDLLPFFAAELGAAGLLPELLDQALFQGGYPPIHDRHLDPTAWFSIQRFLRLCAGRSGQLLNLSALGEEAGVSHNTAREWLSVLEASFRIHRVPPFHCNFNKRLVKTPKLYFTGSGLMAWLLGIGNAGQIATHPLRGALFEIWVVGEFVKRCTNAGLRPNLFFWRDRAGHEIDLLLQDGGLIRPVEIKSGATFQRDAVRGLEKWRDIAGAEAGRPRLVYGGNESQARTELDVVAWREV